MGSLLQGHSGVVSLAAALVGFAWSPLTGVQRALLVAASSPIVFPRAGLEILGVVMAVGTFGWVRLRRATV
jgi:hypothetical protein